MLLIPIGPLWAVHISDGVLAWPWLLGGFLISGVLTAIACRRIRDEEIPRVAVLTMAFFVASSIHIKIGPSSQHLLLNGLVGVVLGWRAPLAILLGVTLQALLIPHGGLTTIGINAANQMVPALLGAGLFRLLHGWFDPTRRTDRWLLIGGSSLLWMGCLWIGIAMLATHPWRGLFSLSTQSGLVLSLSNLTPTWELATHPLALALLGVGTFLCATWLGRGGREPTFPLGLLLGITVVLLTVFLTAMVLLLGGGEQWGPLVNVVFLAHLPLALIEGVILGLTVGFLTRVKPEMLMAGKALPRQEALPAEASSL